MLEYHHSHEYTELQFLGWDEPAIELVAAKLLEGLSTPQTADQYRRATVVVPTSESGRRLREYMAEKAGKSILMPNIKQASRLISREKTYSDIQEYAAWIQVLNNHIPQEERPTAPPLSEPASSRILITSRVGASSSVNILMFAKAFALYKLRVFLPRAFHPPRETPTLSRCYAGQGGRKKYKKYGAYSSTSQVVSTCS